MQKLLRCQSVGKGAKKSSIGIAYAGFLLRRREFREVNEINEISERALLFNVILCY